MMLMIKLLVLLGYIQLSTSLLSIFYTTAKFAQQVRLLNDEESQIKTLSMATAAQMIWRSLILGSRILIFVLFASLFQYWLFVVIGFHYLLMFALVFYQLHLTDKQLIARIVYNIVTPFLYSFDFCMNWLEGPSRYWYLMCYVPMFCENILMSALGLWYASTTPTPPWYIVPGCALVMVMFPLGVLIQLAYYRYWHPRAKIGLVMKRTEHRLNEYTGRPNEHNNETAQKTTRLGLQVTTWNEFLDEVVACNKITTYRRRPC